MLLIGIGYSIYAASLWACIPYVVEPRTIGTAYGFAMAIQNIGMSFAPTFGNMIADNTKNVDFGYYWVIFLYSYISRKLSIGLFSLSPE